MTASSTDNTRAEYTLDDVRPGRSRERQLISEALADAHRRRRAERVELLERMHAWAAWRASVRSKIV